LEQARDEAKIKIRTAQDLQKKRHDQQIKVLLSPFRENDLVLRHKTQNQYSHSSKLETKWDGPFVIHKALPNSVYVLRTLEGKEIKQKVHGSRLKLYKKMRSEPYIDVPDRSQPMIEEEL